MSEPETTAPPRPWNQITDTTKESFATFERELRKNVAENKVKCSFGAAWRDYVASTEFNKLPEHDRALIRVAFVSGWRARGDALRS